MKRFFIILLSFTLINAITKAENIERAYLIGDSLSSMRNSWVPVDHSFKAPLYWDIYEIVEAQMSKDGKDKEDIDVTYEEWDKITDWVAKELKPYGYDMVCTDGYCPQIGRTGSPYMSHYGSMPIKELAEMCKKKGLKLGVYDSPLWVHSPWDIKIPGTDDLILHDLLWDRNKDAKVEFPETTDIWGFQWVMTDVPGAKEYFDGFFKYYHEMGVDFIRIDFLSWYENGLDRGGNTAVSKGYGRERYALALNYIAENAKKYGMFVSLVMPHNFEDAELEKKYGHMVRIDADTANGGWWHFSESGRGTIYNSWPNSNNMFDGFVYWSHISGRERIILDGDFTRLNTFENDAQKRSVISLQLMAGGPISACDTPDNMGENIKFYTNNEMLALNADHFCGRPMSDKLNDPNNQIWYGQMSNGDWVLGIFNRDNVTESFKVNFKDIGISGEMNIRDLWTHQDEGASSSLTITLQPYDCKIVKLTSKNKSYLIGGAMPHSWQIGFPSEMTKTGDNVFVYEGVLNYGGFQALTQTGDWGAPFYVPTATTEVSTDGTTTSAFISNTDHTNMWQVQRIGKYRVTVNYNTNEMTSEFLEATPVYMIGDATSAGWDMANAVAMQPVAGSNVEYNWTGNLKAGNFKITPLNSWDWLDFYRPSGDASHISTSGITDSAVVYRGNDGNDVQWTVDEADEYTLTLNVENSTLTVISGSTTGIGSIASDLDTLNSSKEYYNLQGIRVEVPTERGLYIRRQGNSCQKIMVN